MCGFVINNKLPGVSRFEIGIFPQFFQWPISGIMPVPVTLNEQIGDEISLFLFDKTPFIYDIAQIRPFNFMLKTGAVQTDFGPLMFLLFYVSDPKTPARPFVAMDYQLNPTDPEMLETWRQLASRSHWHVILIDAKPKVVDLFEFENVYDLDDALDQVVKACAGLRVTDYSRAKKEFCDTYSIDDLFAL